MHCPKPIDYPGLVERLAPQIRNQLPFALYRRPGDSRIRALFQADGRLVPPGNWEQPGFVVAPYAAGRHPALSLQPDELLDSLFGPGAGPDPAGFPPETRAARGAHMQRVRDALDAIRAGALEKVVLGRALQVNLKATPLRVFELLLQYYPDAFCYLWFHPATGLWMGATPELLLSCSKGEAQTVSLAGTLPARGDQTPAWGAKERTEQQVVTDYLCDRLKQQGLEPEAGQAQSVRAGDLWHLKTPVRVRAGAGYLDSLLGAIHPTPAVCGQPLEMARAFIEAHEGFDREYYTGYLGPSGLEEPGAHEFYVNLRCMKVREGEGILYVGGGITAASDPAREWEETRQKCGTVWAAVKNSG